MRSPLLGGAESSNLLESARNLAREREEVVKEKIYIEERLSTPSVRLGSLERACGDHLMPPVEQVDNKYLFPLGAS